LQNRAAVKRCRELMGEIVVGEVYVRQVLEAANRSWHWFGYLEVLEGECGHLPIIVASNPNPFAMIGERGGSGTTTAVLP
jgi:hypothetical protein